MTLLFQLNLGFGWSSAVVVTFTAATSITLQDENPDRTLGDQNPDRTLAVSTPRTALHFEG